MKFPVLFSFLLILSILNLNAQSCTADFTPLVSGATVYFQNNSTPSNATYVWRFGNNQSSTQINPWLTYTDTGTYEVTLVATDGICIDSITKVININCIADFNYTVLGNGAIFNSTSKSNSNISSYSWQFDQHGTSAWANTGFTFPGPGNYFVKLEIQTANNCTDTISKLINIPASNCNVDFNYTINNDTVFFNNLTPNLTSNAYFIWRHGNGPFLYGENPAFKFPQHGNHDVTLRILDSGCDDSVTKSIYVPEPLICNASFNTAGMNNGLVRFRNNSVSNDSNITFHWDFGNGDTSTAKEPTHIYHTSGNYTVSLIMQGDSCIDSTSMALNITVLPCKA